MILRFFSYIMDTCLKIFSFMLNTQAEDLAISAALPTPAEFNALREMIGWRCMTEVQTQSSLDQSLFAISVRHQHRLVGFARVIGDGVMYFYVQDVMVHPGFQNQGIGQRMMQQIESWLDKNTQPGSTVGLLSAEGKEGFYQPFGYQCRPAKGIGAGMSRFVSSGRRNKP